MVTQKEFEKYNQTMIYAFAEVIEELKRGNQGVASRRAEIALQQSIDLEDNIRRSKDDKEFEVNTIENPMTLFWDDLDSGEGVVIRPKQADFLAIMIDGQRFHYNNSIELSHLRCPECDSNEHLSFKGDNPEDVSEGYVAACTYCDVDFYLFEIVADKKHLKTRDGVAT